MHLPPAIFLMGPTASGKTGLAVELVQHLPVDIVSVDSALVYRGMDIGTAKPGPEVLEVAPHRLIDILDPAESYSAARFRCDALREMQDITRSGRVPLLVGGTGLYFRALERGLSSLPRADPRVRRQLEEEAATQGWPALHRRLVGVDPDAGARIHPNDPQRIQRALEVFEVTGEAMSDLLARQPGSLLPYRLVKLALAPEDRPWLHDRIARRFQAMLDLGLIEEVGGLMGRGDLSLNLPSMRAVGYRQVWEYLEGKVGWDEMGTRATTATRRLAKRQVTWLRGEERLTWFESREPEVVSNVLKYLYSLPGVFT